jgi:hypothetical protein
MTPLISARRAAEDFARVVDGAQVDTTERFADLTACVDVLRAQEIPEPRAEFVADLRSQLMAAADTLLVPAEPRTAKVLTLTPATRRHQRRLATAAAAFVLVGGTAGLAAAAEHSLPGDSLYPLKRGIESAQVTLNTSDAAKGHDLIDQAGTRLDEVNSLMSRGDSTAEIKDTLGSFQRSAANGADLLFVAFQRNGNPDDLASLRTAFSKQAAQLQQLARQAPPTTQPDFASASSLIASLDQQARVLCANCGPAGGSGVSDLTSAPALGSMLTDPVSAAAADLARSQAQALANKANQIAKNTPQTPAPGTGGSTILGATGSTTGASIPPLSDGTSTVTGTVNTSVKTVTGGVQGLITEVGTASGGTLTPLTDTVNSTLDPVTGLLGGGGQ